MMKRGDRVVRLAAKYNVSMDDLKRLNPDKDLNRLIEGDQLTIKPARPAITVLSKAVENKTEDVDPPVLGGNTSN